MASLCVNMLNSNTVASTVQAWMRSAHQLLKAPNNFPVSQVVDVYLYKLNCGFFWRYDVCFHNVILDFGCGTRGGFFIPGSGIQVHQKSNVVEPDVAVLIGSVELNKAMATAMDMALSGEWRRRDYKFASYNCQCFVERFCDRLGLHIEGDEYLMSKRYVEGMMKKTLSAASTAGTDSDSDSDGHDDDSNNEE